MTLTHTASVDSACCHADDCYNMTASYCGQEMVRRSNSDRFRCELALKFALSHCLIWPLHHVVKSDCIVLAWHVLIADRFFIYNNDYNNFIIIIVINIGDSVSLLDTMYTGRSVAYEPFIRGGFSTKFANTRKYSVKCLAAAVFPRTPLNRRGYATHVLMSSCKCMSAGLPDCFYT